jgi:hypothetical protein
MKITKFIIQYNIIFYNSNNTYPIFPLNRLKRKTIKSIKNSDRSSTGDRFY